MIFMDFIEKIEDFLGEDKSNKQKLIVIYGPTASWKTSMSIDIAKYLDAEIISTDARQIYRYMDIWTWKITHHEMGSIPHYMIDIIDPSDKYSVAKFKSRSIEILDDIYSRWKIPLLVWWTGLYIDSIIYDFELWNIGSDKTLRDELYLKAQEYWNDYVYDMLLDLDPRYARTIHQNNLPYVVRGIEVFKLTGKSKLDLTRDKTLCYDILFLTPYIGDREALYAKINNRVWEMFDMGFVDEVKNMLNIWYTKDDPWLQTMWYRQIVDYLDGNISIDECIEKTKQLNRNYAKRQITWFRNYWKYL